MGSYLDLSAEELQALATLYVSRRGSQSPASRLMWAIDRWHRLVEVLETVGYGVGDIDYVNELGYRESIARAMAAAPSLSDKIGPLIHSLDRRFKDATSPVKRPLGGFLHRGTEIPDDEVNWWYYRYPKKHSRELRADERIGGIEIDEGTA